MAALAPLIAASGCGVEGDRSMLKIYAPSIRETHALGTLIVETDPSVFRPRATLS